MEMKPVEDEPRLGKARAIQLFNRWQGSVTLESTRVKENKICDRMDTGGLQIFSPELDLC